MSYQPSIYYNSGVVAGSWAAEPQGIILHGSRGGHPQSIKNEFDGTRHYAVNEPNGYGWNATIGDDEISIHMSANQWGWNARAASHRFLGVEFAQPTTSYDITDGQIRAFVWWIQNHVLPQWPNIDLKNLPTHAELPEGQADGKTDIYPIRDPRADEVRQRIWAQLNITDDGDEDMAVIDDLKSELGYLSVDVANALQAAHDGIAKSATDADRKDGLDSLQAAINTLKSYKPE